MSTVIAALRVAVYLALTFALVRGMLAFEIIESVWSL